MVVYGLSSSGDPDNIKYIGITKRKLNTRLKEHIKSVNLKVNKRTNWIKSTLNKGENLIINVIDTAITEDELKEKEIFYIKSYKEKGFDLKNDTLGGDGCWGFKMPREHVNKLIKKSAKIFYVYDYKSGNFLFEHSDGVHSLAKKLNLTRGCIRNVLTRKQHCYKGYWFSYIKEFCPPEPKSVWNKNKKLKGKYVNGNSKSIHIQFDNGTIKYYNSLTDAALDLKIPIYIINNTYRRKKYHKKLKFKILDGTNKSI